MIGDRHFLDEPIAVAAGSARPPAVGSGPIERSSMVRAVLPCENCSHRTVCAIRPLLDPDELQYRTPPAPHPAIRITLTATVSCEHYLEDPSWQPEPVQTPNVPSFGPTAAERSKAARNGAQGRRASLVAAKEGQERVTVQTKLGPRAPRSDGAPTYAEATNEALRGSKGYLKAAARALGLKSSSAVTSRIMAMRGLGLVPDDVEALLAAAVAARLGVQQ